MGTFRLKSSQLWPMASEGSEQPMSMMTINPDPSKKDSDLLTIRILESSERKLRLIKQLVSAEEYESLALDISRNSYYKDEQKISVKDTSSRVVSTKSMPVDLHLDVGNEFENKLKNWKSSTALNLPETTDTDLHEKLARKREALDFFFKRSDNSNRSDGDLAMELRSSRYLNAGQNQTGRPILRENDFGLMDRLVGLLSFFGISFNCAQEPVELVNEEIEGCSFESYYRQKNCEPYTRKRNLVKMRDRLKADGHQQLLGTINSPGVRKLSSAIPASLVDLAKMNTNHLVPYDELSEHLRKIQQKLLIRLVSHFDAVRPMPNASFSELVQDIDLLSYHPNAQKLIDYTRPLKRATSTDSSSFQRFCPHYLEIELFALDFIQHPLMVDRENLYELAVPDIRCSLNELTRRNNIRTWFQSLKATLLIGDEYYHVALPKLKTNHLFSMVLDTKLMVPIASHVPLEPVKVRVVVEKPRSSLLPFGFRIVAFGKTKNALRNQSKTQTINLKSGNRDIEANLTFKAVIRTNERQVDQKKMRDETRRTIDNLHALIFANRNPYDDTSRKISRLLNKVDLNVLYQLLEGKLTGLDFVLDPYEDSFQEGPTSLHMNDVEHPFDPVIASKLNSKHWINCRQALILWRWLNQTKQLIYLSERENIKHYGLQIEDNKTRSRLSIRHLDHQEASYRVIEQMRTWAAEYLKQYEADLRETLKFNAEKSVRPVGRSRELLLEPKLKINLSGAWHKTLNLVPKRTAHRPLLPKRGTCGTLNRSANNDARGLSMLSMPSQTDLEQAPHVDEGHDQLTTTHEIASHWHQVATQRNRLQLVITIQQAINVPLRVVQSSSVPPPRSSSPFDPTPSPVASFLPSQQHQLQAPVCYVELVFQRRQQASSLAHGKNPAWNETLFFPVETGDTRTLSNQSQLADEFLQLNLYDYHCYFIQDLQLQNEQMADLSTLPTAPRIASNFDGFPASPVPAQQTLQGPIVRASRQHIERHLLGSLRIPLSSLMSSGKIEGSFALNQPLFLDNHQFDMMDLSQNTRPINSPTGSRQINRFKVYETLISLFITLDPPVSVPMHLYLPTASALESEQVFQYARLWEQIVSQQHYRWVSANKRPNLSTPSFGTLRRPNHLQQSRHVRALVLQRGAKYCLITRLLGPVAPPQDILSKTSELSDIIKILARFVSLMTPLKYGLLGMRLLAASLWFDCSQLVNANLGGPEEKATLLCNYFLYLGKCSALLLGDSVPEGRCVWVLVWDEKSRFIEDQLQLQAANLLESIGNLALGEAQPPPLDAGTRRPPVDKGNFFARLPSTMNASSLQLWDPCSGKSYGLSDALPLISVGSIVTVENVYANIQSVDQPAKTNFDIRSRQSWFPLFDFVASNAKNQENAAAISEALGNSIKRNLAGTKKVHWRRQMSQLEGLRRLIGRPHFAPHISPYSDLNYQSLNDGQCLELKEAIERSVKSHLIQLRPDRPTYFNRTLSRLLADRLVHFESLITNTRPDSGGDSDSATYCEGQWKSELAQLVKDEIMMAHLSTSGYQTRQVISCPVNIPYTTMKSILDTVFANGIHNADLVVANADLQRSISSTQFLIACHVHPYPARVASIWLYAAAIVPDARYVIQSSTRSLLSP